MFRIAELREKMGISMRKIEEIATIIWLCSDDEYCDILLKLREERVDYWKRMFGIENANQTYKVVDIFGKNFKLTFKQIVTLLAASDYESIKGIYDLDGNTVWEYECE